MTCAKMRDGLSSTVSPQREQQIMDRVDALQVCEEKGCFSDTRMFTAPATTA
jgi:hypothetical protein